MNLEHTLRLEFLDEDSCEDVTIRLVASSVDVSVYVEDESIDMKCCVYVLSLSYCFSSSTHTDSLTHFTHLIILLTHSLTHSLTHKCQIRKTVSHLNFTSKSS